MRLVRAEGSSVVVCTRISDGLYAIADGNSEAVYESAANEGWGCLKDAASESAVIARVAARAMHQSILSFANKKDC